ncbi:hypothetical protein [Bradyrhizobium sp. CCBAU 051011]|uniref:hypothetical protein n=1 Tax=Bradyrhizobium sp. CCBAU 051011 TaxID=858422 RepID=UPI00137B3EAB|nr:hypothetical protein [Bradyrhizobium sp. CCBAU 051011]
MGEEAYRGHLVGMHFAGAKKRPPETREVGMLLAEISEVRAQDAQIREALYEVEWQIGFADVSTQKGYEAQVREINKAEFDDGDLVMMAWQLGRSAARPGISKPPNLELEADRDERRRKESEGHHDTADNQSAAL